MAAKKKKVKFVKLVCSECKKNVYYKKKSKKATQRGVKLQLKKYCKFCKKHTLHKEGK